MATTLTALTTKQEKPERKKVKKKISKAQMQLAIIKKKQCDAKALIIVEQLLEPTIDSQWLLQNLRFINRSHMEDVIEERAIIKLCGYVLCNNAITAVIGQQYHISTRRNKVYDVTRRKNFCSSRCYGACNFLLEQMLASPLWLRDKEEIPEFKVLPAKDELQKSVPGDEIHVRDASLIFKTESTDESAEFNTMCKDPKNIPFNRNAEFNIDDEFNTLENTRVVSTSAEVNKIKKSSNTFKEHFTKASDVEIMHVKEEFINSRDANEIQRDENSIKEYINDEINKEVSSSENNTSLDYTVTPDTKTLNNIISLNENTNKNHESNSEQNQQNKKLENICDTNINEHNAINDSRNYIQKLEKTKRKKHKQKDSVKQERSDEFYNLAVHIEHNVREWITEDTIFLLSGQEDTKNRLLESIAQHDKYLHLCKKLNKLQLEDEKDDRADLNKNNLKPLPHLSVLQEEGKKMELKVRAFYKGDTVIETPVNMKENTKKDDDFVPVLPLVDSHAPRALRRRIFLDKLNRILPDLLRALAGSKYSRYTYDSERSVLIKALVSTFSLSASNITFKTAEWTLVGLIIIKMLGLIDPQMKILLSARQASMYISMILMSYKLDSNYLDRLVMELTNNVKTCDIDNTTNF